MNPGLFVLGALLSGGFFGLSLLLLGLLRKKLHPVTGAITDLIGTAAAGLPFVLCQHYLGNGTLSLYPVAAFMFGAIFIFFLAKRKG